MTGWIEDEVLSIVCIPSKSNSYLARAWGSLAKIPLRMADMKVTATVRLHKESGYFIDAALDLLAESCLRP